VLLAALHAYTAAAPARDEHGGAQITAKKLDEAGQEECLEEKGPHTGT
jgi:hypothetical protein